MQYSDDLFKALKLEPKQISSSVIGFNIAPIFNAVGRIANPALAVKYFLVTLLLKKSFLLAFLFFILLGSF